MAGSNSPYLLGVSRCDVTPPIGTHLAGYAARLAPSTGVYHPLTCTVTALTDPAVDRTLILVSIEWLGFYENTDRVRGIIQQQTGVPGDQVLLCGTHTHCGPLVRPGTDSRRHGGIDLDYLDRTFATIGLAAAEAMNNRKPVRAFASTGWCGFAHSRRKPDGKGGVAWMPTLDAPHDHTVPLVVFEDRSGAPVHLLFGYACHPTSAGPIRDIGGDYVGFALDHISTRLGCTASFILGCAGDQKPYIPDPGQPAFPNYPIEAIRQLGEQLADAVIRAVDSEARMEIGGNLQISGRKLTLHNEVQSEAVYKESLDASEEHVRTWAAHNLAAMAGGGQPATDLAFELQSVCLGRDLALIAMAGEMSVEYGLRLHRQFGRRFGCVWAVGYANEMVGYVPAARQYPEGGYEVLDNMQYLLRPGPLSRDSEERIFEAVEGLLRHY
jgi:hypothetical protein